MTAEATVAGVEFDIGEPLLPIEAGAPESTYKFDEDFQAKITAMCVYDTNFMQRTEGLVRPEYFENIADAHLVDMVNRYFQKYKKVPGDEKVLTMLIKHDKIKKIIKPEMVAPVVRRAIELRTADISDREFVVDQVATFARHQAVSKAILESVGHLDFNDFDKINATLKKALDIGARSSTGGYDFGAMIGARTEERIERAAGKLPPTGVSTGYPEIDKHLYHKGWGFRELSVLMGAAKMGKTTALIDFGICAASHMYRYNVLYVTCEVSAKIIAERADARVSDQIMFELGSHSHEIKKKVEEWNSKAGKFIIEEFPSGSAKVSDLRRLIEHYKAQGTKFDLVIVDYADLMSPERYTDSSTENSKSVYVALRGFAMEEGCAVLTATQTNRDGAKKMVATMTDVAEDFNKIRIADLVISINKTEDERALNQARLYWAAARNGASNFSIRIEQDTDRMRFIRSVIGEE